MRSTICGLGCVVFSIGLLIWAPGCGDDYCNPDDEIPTPFRARTSPEYLLYNLRAAYAERSVAEVESLLAPDFEYVFCPYDQS